MIAFVDVVGVIKGTHLVLCNVCVFIMQILREKAEWHIQGGIMTKYEEGRG